MDAICPAAYNTLSVAADPFHYAIRQHDSFSDDNVLLFVPMLMGRKGHTMF